MCAASLGVAIAEKSYGPEHPNIARHLNNVAGLYYTKAEPLYRRALRDGREELRAGPSQRNLASHDPKTIADVHRPQRSGGWLTNVLSRNERDFVSLIFQKSIA
jgi:hypothetical protein